jgi:hypothetical protein
MRMGSLVVSVETTRCSGNHAFKEKDDKLIAYLNQHRGQLSNVF